jgi:hypothetical protein
VAGVLQWKQEAGGDLQQRGAGEAVRKSPPAPLSAVSPGADEDAAVCGAVPTPLPRAADSQPTRRLRWTSARSARWVSRPRRGYASSRRSRQQQAAGSRLQVELGKGTGEGAVQGCECIFHLQMHTVSSLGELSFRIDQSPTPGMCTGQTRSARGSARRRARDSCDRRNCLAFCASPQSALKPNFACSQSCLV